MERASERKNMRVERGVRLRLKLRLTVWTVVAHIGCDARFSRFGVAVRCGSRLRLCVLQCRIDRRCSVRLLLQCACECRPLYVLLRWGHGTLWKSHMRAKVGHEG